MMKGEKLKLGGVVDDDTKVKSIIPARILIAATICTCLASVPLIMVGFWLAHRHHINCLKFLEGPIIAIGMGVCIVSVVGAFGAICRQLVLLWVYFIGIFLFLLLLFAFTVFAAFVSQGGGGHSATPATFLEYRLSDFSLWFQQQTRNPSQWVGMRACIQDQKPCASLNKKYPTLDDFYTAKLSPIQSGCCKPPRACGFTFVLATRWVNTTHATASSDCGRWENDPSSLCYNCTSCRAGLLQYVKNDWILVAKACLLILLLLVLFYVIAWAGFLKALWDDIYSAKSTLPKKSHSNLSPESSHANLLSFG